MCGNDAKTLDKRGLTCYDPKRPKQILWNKEESKMKEQSAIMMMMMMMLMRMCSMCMLRCGQFGHLISRPC